MTERILDFDEALEVVLGQARTLARPRTETVPLPQSRGRVLAQELRADRDQPAFDRATRDGYALRSGETGSGRGLRVIGQVRAGESWDGPPLAAGEAVEIMTGAPLPAGADAVVMVEHVAEADGAITLGPERRLAACENVVAAGAEARAGDVLLAAGVTMGAAEVALAAACGATDVTVYRQPRAAIVATGDELVEVGETPGVGQIRNSNSYGIAALVEAAGAIPQRLPVARDLREDLRERIGAARSGAELLLLSGGVSMGKYDLVEEVLRELGAEFFFTGVRMQPGKPLVFGRLPGAQGDAGSGCFFFGLPGNPVSTQVTFHCFAEPLLRAMAGAEVSGPRFAQATMAEEAAGKPGLMRVLPAHLLSSRTEPRVRVVPWQGSGDMAANARANCYVVLGPEAERFRVGDTVSVMLR